jgi:hypothetical protein
MVKKILMLSLLAAALSVNSTINKMQDVDAVSAATVHLKCTLFVPIKVTATSATITWGERRPNKGTAVISWGTSTTNMTNRQVTTTERSSKSLTLNELIPETTYKIRYEASDNIHTPYADTATIKTKSTTFSTPNFKAQKNIPLEFLDHSVRLGTMAKNGDRVTIADSKGRTLLDHHVKGTEKAINLPSHAKGVYFLTYTREGKILDKKQFVITHK